MDKVPQYNCFQNAIVAKLSIINWKQFFFKPFFINKFFIKITEKIIWFFSYVSSKFLNVPLGARKIDQPHIRFLL